MAARTPAPITRRRRSALLHGIYAILNEDDRTVQLAHDIVEAGVKIVQYRAKLGINHLHLQQLRRITHEHDALLIVNDDWRAARDAACDGVHLGPDDDGFTNAAPIRQAHPQWIVGLSCGTVDEAAHATASDVDYLGVGSVYASPSKADAGEPIGIAGLVRIAQTTRLPVAAIGGIGADNLADVRQTGVAMAAVISAIAGAANAALAARHLVGIWEGVR